MNPLETLVQKVRDLDSFSFIVDNISEKEVEKACINYLKSLNYKVTAKPSLFTVRDIDDLITTFYSLLDYTHNSTCAMVSNRDKDRALLSNFVKGRQSILEVSYDSALQDTALIIHGLFNYEKELGLTVPIGTWVFGSTRFKWVIDKVIYILNAQEDLTNDFEVDRLAAIDEAQSKEYIGYDFEHLRRVHG
ncbi:hypothetical protein JZU46_07080 [bacterium]|nr:hypothetical protein [bacterium]